MKLISFSVRNYRSITVAHKISTGNMTVLVGKNNEGKSNILKAITLAMEIMTVYAENPRALERIYQPRYSSTSYQWERDFPLQLQNNSKNNKTVFALEFLLTEAEISELRQITGIKLNSPVIPIKISLDKVKPQIDVPKPGSSAFKTHSREIANFVCARIRFNHIPAVRTDQHALQVIEYIIASELRELENNPEYKEANERITRLQQGIFDRIADQIVTPLSLFIPTIRSISISPPAQRRRPLLRTDFEVSIDDGVLTGIETKGDGVKSLTALAMLNMYRKNESFVSIIAIEEPESHLHPEAMHQLYETIASLSAQNQIILTTHSPLFVNREKPSCNIIVDHGKATPAKGLREIREVLGILVSDNLVNANFVLVVEGEEDKVALMKILPKLSDKVKRALANNSLLIFPIGGASNLSYHINQLITIQCKFHVLLDHDEAGRSAYERALSRRLLTTKDVTFTICQGSPDSEFEDCLETEFYYKQIEEKFGVDLKIPKFRGRGKWSDRVKECFYSFGKRWDDDIEAQVKKIVADSIPENIDIALHPRKRECIDALVIEIEAMIS